MELQAPSQAEQAYYLFAMAHIMSCWKGADNNGLIVKTGQL